MYNTWATSVACAVPGLPSFGVPVSTRVERLESRASRRCPQLVWDWGRGAGVGSGRGGRARAVSSG